MKKLKKDLQSVSKQLKALENKMEKMMDAVAKLEKVQVKTKAKPKPGRKVAAKKLPAKKAGAQTATGQVVSVIKRSKKGVDVPALMKNDGLGRQANQEYSFQGVQGG